MEIKEKKEIICDLIQDMTKLISHDDCNNSECEESEKKQINDFIEKIVKICRLLFDDDEYINDISNELITLGDSLIKSSDTYKHTLFDYNEYIYDILKEIITLRDSLIKSSDTCKHTKIELEVLLNQITNITDKKKMLELCVPENNRFKNTNRHSIIFDEENGSLEKQIFELNEIIQILRNSNNSLEKHIDDSYERISSLLGKSRQLFRRKAAEPETLADGRKTGISEQNKDDNKESNQTDAVINQQRTPPPLKIRHSKTKGMLANPVAVLGRIPVECSKITPDKSYASLIDNLEKRIETPQSKKKSLDRIEQIVQEASNGIASPGQKKSSIQLDQVQFTALAPAKLTAEHYSSIKLIMYEDDYRYIVEKMISESNEDVAEKSAGSYAVKKGAEVKAVLSSNDVLIEQEEDLREWQGRYLSFDFAVKLPKDCARTDALIKAAVYINGVIATRLNLIIECSNESSTSISISRKDIMTAFVSYASQDRATVVSMIMGMKAIRPELDVFLDVEKLRRNDNWEKVLYKEIDARDVLYLCWSSHASKSEWVDKEWRYAFSKKGEDSIEAFPIEPQEKCPPPPEVLKDKHFNDILLYILYANKPKEE